MIAQQERMTTTAITLQRDPTNPGMHLHKFDRAKDPSFGAARVGKIG